MYGDMYGDFSRLTFDRGNGYSSVMRLQGRVGIEADDNENTAILLHLLRTFTADVIGPFGGPAAGPLGFAIGVDREGARVADLSIGPGRYYVDGILAEREDGTRYFEQPDLLLDAEESPLPDVFPFLVYLKVWERFVTAVEVPYVREVALGASGADSAARTKVVAQVMATPFVPGTKSEIELKSGPKAGEKLRDEILIRWRDESWDLGLAGARGALLSARAESGDVSDDPCTLSPFARYRGAENQLYRVQCHVGGDPASSTPTPTFKWSRDNGSIVFPIETVAGEQVVVRSLGRDELLSLEVGQWVELVDDATALADPVGEARPPAPLYRVEAIEELERRVTLDRDVEGGGDLSRHPLLRRWDQAGPEDAFEGGALRIPEAKEWVELEDGVQVQFAAGRYRSGEFWGIPARTETGDVEWPGEPDAPVARPADGPGYHFAPLALVTGSDVVDLRCAFGPLACGVPQATKQEPPKEPKDPKEPKGPKDPKGPKPGGPRPRSRRKAPS
jgi:hypothetical protein